jgi:tripartite-type tricarboxylate transporter receptor subunit TctC
MSPGSDMNEEGRVTKFLPAVAVAAILGTIGSATAQVSSYPVYPSHPITMGMPFAAGGPGDTLARILAERMRAAGIKGE